MNTFARLGFLLLGTHGILSALRSVIAIATMSEILSAPIDVDMLPSVVTILALSLLPSSLLIIFNRQLAGCAFPSDDSRGSNLDTSTLLSVGVAILGLYFVIVGASALISSFGLAVISWNFLDEAGVLQPLVSSALAGVTNFALGALLFQFGPRAIHAFAARRHAV